MASVWMQKVGDPTPKKLRGSMSLATARSHFDALVRKYRKEGNPVKLVSGCDVLLYTKGGELSGSLFIEPYSPPSAPEPGQPKRMQKDSSAK